LTYLSLQRFVLLIYKNNNSFHLWCSNFLWKLESLWVEKICL